MARGTFFMANYESCISFHCFITIIYSQLSFFTIAGCATPASRLLLPCAHASSISIELVVAAKAYKKLPLLIPALDVVGCLQS